MMGNVVKSFGVLVLSLLAIQPVSASAETLGQTLVDAYQNSGLLEQNRALLRAADEDVATATAAMRPVAQYLLSSEYNTVTELVSTDLGVSLSMLLYDFGAGELRRSAARENVMTLREGLRQVEQNVLLSAVVAHSALRRDAAIVTLRESNVRLIGQELQAARDRFEVGEITRTDVTQAEARLAAAQAGLTAARGALAQSREEYRAVTGHYPRSAAAPATLPQTASSLEAARAQARQRHPSILQAQHAVSAADLGVQVAKAARNPQLTGLAQAGIDQDGNKAASVELNFGGALYQGGAISAAYRKAVAQRDAARAGLHLAQLNVERNVGTAWAQLSVAKAGLTANDELIRASQAAFDGMREEAKLGARTTLDVLNAEQDLLDARAARLTSDSDRSVAVYTLLASMGLLNAEHLGLGITTYDPGAYYDAVKNAPLGTVSTQGKALDKALKAIGQ